MYRNAALGRTGGGDRSLATEGDSDEYEGLSFLYLQGLLPHEVP